MEYVQFYYLLHVHVPLINKSQLIGLPVFYSCTNHICVSAYAKWNKSSLSTAMLKDLQERCPNIRELELIRTNLSAVSSEYLPRKLHNLYMTFCFIPPHWFKPVSKEMGSLDELRELDLSLSTKLSNDDLADLRCASGLTSLKINGCYRVTDSGLKTIADGFPKLQTLEMADISCVDLALALHHICRGLPDLQRLKLGTCKISNDAMAEIGCMKKLEWLCMVTCEVTATGLAHLSNLKLLRYCDVSGCQQITEEIVQVVRNALPLCEFIVQQPISP